MVKTIVATLGDFQAVTCGLPSPDSTNISYTPSVYLMTHAMFPCVYVTKYSGDLQAVTCAFPSPNSTNISYTPSVYLMTHAMFPCVYVTKYPMPLLKFLTTPCEKLTVWERLKLSGLKEGEIITLF